MTTPFPEDNGWPYTTLSIGDDYNQVNRFPEWTQLLAGKLYAALGAGPPTPGDPGSDTGWRPIAVNGDNAAAYSAAPEARIRNGIMFFRGGFTSLSGTGDRVLGTIPSDLLTGWPTSWFVASSANDGELRQIFISGSSGDIATRFGAESDPTFVLLNNINFLV